MIRIFLGKALWPTDFTDQTPIYTNAIQIHFILHPILSIPSKFYHTSTEVNQATNQDCGQNLAYLEETYTAPGIKCNRHTDSTGVSIEPESLEV